MTIRLIVGAIAGTLCTISFIPQVLRVYRTKNARDLSLVTFIMFSLGVSLWFVYGLLIEELPVIIANGLTLILGLFIVAMKLRYK